MKNQSIILTLVLCFASSLQAFAGETLTADQVKKLISGKTVHGKHLKKGFDFSVYFAEDGTIIRKWKGGKLQDGKYFFKDNLHCINVGGDDKCAAMVDNGDGTYNRLKNGDTGKHFITWTKIVAGKNI